MLNKLKESDKGRKVIYSSYKEKEEGIITSWNKSFIFVCFDNSGRGQACRPTDLIFTFNDNEK